MATTTPNFGWSVPTSTDLVKDGATAIETLGDAIDASLVDLKGGTTGQVLAKASATDMDFSWVTNAGDIEGVTAGIGISGGGTSGTVTITNSMATAIDAKGDLVAGTGADAFSRLAVGTNNQVLTADSSTGTGLKWATPAGGGKILQVVSSTITTNATITSTSMTDTNITQTITPTSASSKILVMITAVSQNQKTGTQLSNNARLLRGATNIYDLPNGGWYDAFWENLTSGYNSAARMSTMTYLDSPATTSATTYKLQAAVPNVGGSHTVIFQPTSMGASQIILMEVGA